MRAALIVVAVVGLLSGCAAPAEFESPKSGGASNGYLSEEVIVLSDGRKVTCVVYAAGYKGGLSCDWAGASK